MMVPYYLAKLKYQSACINCQETVMSMYMQVSGQLKQTFHKQELVYALIDNHENVQIGN